jgi:APA family basic amino acid/polyamine antiporter
MKVVVAETDSGSRSEVGAPPLFLGVWVVGGILSFFGALAFGELAAAYPQAGGAYVYRRKAYGPMVAFRFGWTLFPVVDSGAIATLAVAFSSRYLPVLIPLSRRPPSSWPRAWWWRWWP